MNDPVLDSSALLAFLLAEPGAEQVRAVLPDGLISAVNWAEVMSRLCDIGVPAEEAREVIEGTGVQMVGVDAGQAFDIGALRPLTRHLGLSLGDRACLALARRLGRTAMTADRAWSQLDGFEVRLIRP